MNHDLDSHSPAAAARLRMGWDSSMPHGAGISRFSNFAVLQVAPQTVPIAVPK